MTYEALLKQATQELHSACAEISASPAHCIQHAYELAEYYQGQYPELILDVYFFAEILLARSGF
jgi:hypothetical protein